MILALDQATRISGYSIWDNDKLITYGHFSFSDEDVTTRIHKMCSYILDLLKKYPQVDQVILEDIHMHGNDITTYQKLAWLQGAILELLYIKQYKTKILHPTEWRSKCHSLKGQDKRRNAQKALAREWVLNNFNQICTDDEADAICIGYAATQMIDHVLEWE